jgi:hypothetical protein
VEDGAQENFGDRQQHHRGEADDEETIFDPAKQTQDARAGLRKGGLGWIGGGKITAHDEYSVWSPGFSR